MIKKLLYGFVIAAGLVSCNDDYTDWASPQHNDQPEPVAFANGSVTPVGVVDFADITEDQAMVQVCNITAPTASDESYNTVTYKLNLGAISLPISLDGQIAVADLKAYIEETYGKAPEVRAIPSTVEQWISNGNTVIKTATSEEFNIQAKLVAPYISNGYWLIGAPTQWDPMCMDKPFSHSDKNVYDDPVFTVVFTVEAGDTWFAIADDKTHASGDWSDVLGCAEGNGMNGMDGHIGRRCDIGNDGSWKISVEKKCNVMMTINMMDYTYHFDLIPAASEYYIVGRQNNWKLSNTENGSAFYVDADGNFSYTSYFTGAYDCRIATLDQIQSGDWNNFGAAEETGSCTTLVPSTGKCITSPAEGYYTLNVDFDNMTYSWTPITDVPEPYEKIGLIGDFNGWAGDLELTKVAGSGDLNGCETHNWNAIGVEIPADGALKFRANGGWSINWGATASAADPYIFGTGVQDGSNINVTAGTYNVYFNDITGQFLFIKQ